MKDAVTRNIAGPVQQETGADGRSTPARSTVLRSRTDLHHSDGRRTEIRTDRDGTTVERFNRDGERTGREDNRESHEVNVGRSFSA